MAAVIVCDLVAAKAFVVGSVEGGWAYLYVREIPAHSRSDRADRGRVDSRGSAVVDGARGTRAANGL